VSVLLEPRPLVAKIAMAASPIVLLLGKSSSIGRKTILVLEIILWELVHHLGVLCSRLIICTHRIETVEVFITAIHPALPPVPVSTSEIHHVIYGHAHVSTKAAIHAVRHIGHIHVEIYQSVSIRTW
jgi:hypothetical protein